MKKLIYILFLLPFFVIGQVSDGTETEFEALKTTNSQTVINPVYLGTEGIDGTIGKVSSTAFEKTANKAIDFSTVNNSLYPTIQAVKTALDTKAIDSEVIHTTGNETKSGFLTLSDQLTFGEASDSPQELWKMPANSLLKYNNSNSTPQYGFDITSLGADSFFWVNEEGNSRQALLFADGDAVADSDIFGISASQDIGDTYIKNFSITQAGKGYFRDALNALNYNIGTGYNVSLQPIRNQFASFFNQPFFTSDQGYSVFKPSGSNMPSRFYIMPNGTPTGTTSKFEMFNSDYSADYTTYNGFNILLNNTTQQIDIGSNRGSSGGARQKLRIGGDYAGSSFIANSSAIDMNTDNTINLNPFGGSVSIGTATVDPFSISLANQVTFKNPTTAQAIRLNLIGNGAAAGLYYGRDAIRTASIATQATTSDVEFSTNPTNTGTTLVPNMRIWSATGNVSIQNGGGFTDNLQGKLQVTGNITASAATLANQVVIKSQHDLKADIASPALTGNPTAPTPTAGDSDTSIATTAFVQANSRPYKSYVALLSQTGTSAPVATVLENTLGGTVVWTRNSIGDYSGTLTGAFTLDKTTCNISLSTNVTGLRLAGANRFDSNTVKIYSSNLAGAGVPLDIAATLAYFEIRVYL
jgi:hypothetical protein